MIPELGTFEQFQKALETSGLLLCDMQPLNSLPDNIWLAEPEMKGGSLLLIGHAGREFWQAFKQSEIAGRDPVDDFSAQITEQALKQYFPNIPRKQLFPIDDCSVNLMALGKAFGWHYASPLGMGIHTKYGLWSAYRALWWLDSPDLRVVNPNSIKPVLKALQPTNVCAECQTQECIAACPAGALTYETTPNLVKCADFRLVQQSACESTCLSRMACPHGAEYRYDTEQMSYHYNFARSAIAAYRSDK